MLISKADLAEYACTDRTELERNELKPHHQNQHAVDHNMTAPSAHTHSHLVTAIVALGGNLGDVPSTFEQAAMLVAADSTTTNLRVSRLYRSAPMGTHAGATFFNAAIAFETTLEPESLLDRLQAVETELGRVRMIHWGPRTLDLDLVAFGDRTLRTSRLCVPHPHCWYRRFVLDPVNDIAGERIHVVSGLTFQQLRERLLARPLRITIDAASLPSRDILDRLHAEFPQCDFIPWASENSAMTIKMDSHGTASDAFDVVCQDLPNAEQFIRDVLTAATDELVTSAKWPRLRPPESPVSVG